MAVVLVGTVESVEWVESVELVAMVVGLVQAMVIRHLERSHPQHGSCCCLLLADGTLYCVSANGSSLDYFYKQYNMLLDLSFSPRLSCSFYQHSKHLALWHCM